MKAAALAGIAILFTGLLLVTGCSNSTTSPSTGELKLFLTDSPSVYDQVNIVVTKVEVHSAGSDSLSGWSVIRQDTTLYDLLTLRNGANAILGDAMLPVGHYTQIRLSFGAGSNVVVNGVPHTLDVSSATGLKLNHEFTIQGGALYELTLDFDANKSIVLTGTNQYKLDPVIRLVVTQTSGTISGTVTPASAHSVVSTIAGTDTVSTNCDTTSGFFDLVALPAGTYDVAITPTDTAYRDTTITGVAVVAQQNTNIGVVALTHR